MSSVVLLHFLFGVKRGLQVSGDQWIEVTVISMCVSSVSVCLWWPQELGSKMAYTIIRPGGLKSEPATGNGVLTEDTAVCGAIHREDVAELIARAAFSEATNNKVCCPSLAFYMPNLRCRAHAHVRVCDTPWQRAHAHLHMCMCVCIIL
jgi:hypothetical protein